MKPNKVFAFLALTTLLCASKVAAQEKAKTPPTKAEGQTVKTLVTHDIGPQIPELQGYYLQMRLRTLEPGGYGPLHSHKETAVILYVVQGTLTVCTPEGKCTELHEGQAVGEGKDVVHWAANRGTKALAYLAAEIIKKP